MSDKDFSKRLKQIERTTLIGSLGNFALTLFKFIAGIIGHSGAMIADAVHSLSDFVTDIIVLVFVRIANKPSDRDHTYGHGKYETLATAIIGIMLLAVGVMIAIHSIEAIIKYYRGEMLERPGMIAFVAALISIILKEGLYRYTKLVADRVDSSALLANAWHHRSDALSSIATAIGIGGAILLGEKWRVLDPIAALLVSVLIVKVAINLFMPCFGELMEKSLSADVEEKILKTIAQNHEVVSPHNLRTRRVGQVNVVDVHVRMPGDMSVTQSHAVTVKIEQELRAFLGANAIINIHVEPIKSPSHDKC